MGRQALVLYKNKIRMSVRLSVRPLSTFRELDKCAHIIYGWKRNLSSNVQIYISNLSDQLSGRYWPESGHDWKTPAKIGLFLEVFVKFHTLPYTVFIPNFKRR